MVGMKGEGGVVGPKVRKFI